MTQWHADIDRSDLGPGARLTVLSDHHVVRVVTADILSIETPAGPRFSAVVQDRTAGDLRLVLSDGRASSLRIVLDESLHSRAVDIPKVFSRQVWLAH